MGSLTTTQAKLRNSYFLSKLPDDNLQEYLLICSSAELRIVHGVTIGQTIYAPPIQSRVKWTKFIIKQLETRRQSKETQNDVISEEEEEDMIEEWYNSLQQLCSIKPETEPFYRLYVDDQMTDVIKILENETAFVSQGTTGLVTWEASLELSKHLATEAKGMLDSVNWVIELGSGCGYLAISVCRLKSQSTPLQKYIVTEGNYTALARCEENVNANYQSGGNENSVTFLKLDWIDPEDFIQFTALVEEYTKQYGTGLLLGADIIFDPELVNHVLQFCNEFLRIQSTLRSRKEGGSVILSCTIRNENTIDHLKTQLNLSGREWEQSSKWSSGIMLRIK